MTGLTLYYSERVDIDCFSAYDLDIGLESYTSEAAITLSSIEISNTGIRALNESDIDIDNSVFCGTDLDLYAYNFSSIYASSCFYDNGVPSISEGGGSTIQSVSNQSCPSLSAGKESTNYYSATVDNSVESEFERINSNYFSINKKLADDLKSKITLNSEEYSTEYEEVIEGFNEFIKNNPDSPLSKLAIIITARCYRRIDDLRGESDATTMKDYLTDVLSNKEYSGLQPTAERLMIDYYSGIDDYTNAIERADNLLEKYSNDSSYYYMQKD